MRGRLYFFTGLDGSGKTTQAERFLERALPLDRGWAYRWARWEPWFTQPLMAMARRLLGRGQGRGSARPEDDAGHREFLAGKQRLFRRRWVRGLWTGIVLLEYLPQVWWRVLPSLLRGRRLICDRYLPDVWIDLAMNFGGDIATVRALSRHPLARLFPRPHRTLLFDVEPSVGYDRKRDGTPQAYLEDRRPLYRALAEELGATVIDANRGLDEVEARVWEALMGGEGPQGGR